MWLRDRRDDDAAIGRRTRAEADHDDDIVSSFCVTESRCDGQTELLYHRRMHVRIRSRVRTVAGTVILLGDGRLVPVLVASAATASGTREVRMCVCVRVRE